ncbi:MULTISPECIES: hypothetical protein [Amycolatopsis]|uniref:hypothetical protein n=1 Tax=Amycolatopsis TaxID=1813 RepID=UPI00382638E4
MTSSAVKLVFHAVHAGGTLVRGVRAAIDPSARNPAAAGRPASGWLAVTVFRECSELESAALPAPLAEFGDRIEVRVRPAPGGKGTELAARMRDGQPPGKPLNRLSGSDPQAGLRSALRRAKQVFEVGEVLAVDPAPHGKRSATPGGALLEAWTRVAPKGGVR